MSTKVLRAEKRWITFKSLNERSLQETLCLSKTNKMIDILDECDLLIQKYEKMKHHGIKSHSIFNIQYSHSIKQENKVEVSSDSNLIVPFKNTNCEESKPSNAIQCYQCGEIGHTRNKCPYLNQRLQAQKPMYGSNVAVNGTANSASIGNPPAIKKVHNLTIVDQKIEGKCLINNVLLNVEVDTGADLTIISEDAFNQFKHPKIKKAKLKLALANYTPVDIVGKV